MIKKITINNIAIIDSLEFELSNRLNIVTGETGSGKSIIIKSIQYLKGAKFNKDDLRKGAESASIEALVSINNKDMHLKRKISKNFVSSFYINNNKITFDEYSKIVSNNIDIHNQHDHHDLLNEESHISYLDIFSENHSLLEDVCNFYEEWTVKKKEMKKLILKKEEYLLKKELYELQSEELSKIELIPDMEKEITSKFNLLSNSKVIKQNIEEIKNILNNDLDNSIVSNLNNSIKKTQEMVNYGEDFKKLNSRLESVNIEINDLSFDLDNLSNQTIFDSEEFTAIEDKITLLNSLKNKYGSTIQEVINYKNDLEKKLLDSKNFDKDISIIEKEINDLRIKLINSCEKLSLCRHKEKKNLENIIKSKFIELDLNDAEIKFDIKSDEIYLSENGYDQCKILVKTNKGEDFKSLTYIASGGEVSRIMLSIKLSLQEKVNSEVLVFDEVDSGISGSTASKIGNALSDLSNLYQVVCVTHLPQIASKSTNNHYKIYKSINEDRVTSKIEKLNVENKINEVARLLSGERITLDSLKQAQNMIVKQ
jgi:DNA repair protein RecN (Recombination protein N)